ncbi:MAG: phosphoadenylyl-sulfate reductase [Acidimicrobiia bacterium]
MTTLNEAVHARPLVDVDLGELAAVSAALEQRPAGAAIRWAHDRFGSGLVLAASFQDCVLIDIAVKAAPSINVVFLDTQYHFAETLWYVERVRELYDLELTVMQPLVPADDLWQTDTDECCAMRKVEPLARALQGRQAWMSGVRRVEAPSRTNTQIVHLDVGRGIVKVNPLAGWTNDDIAAYKRDHDLPEHPLVAQGYPSIGCWPCTRAVAPGEDPRSGRWSATGKTECGLHGWPQP